MIIKNIYFHGNREKKDIALTFDDGPCKDTLEVLSVLKRYNVKATFFVLGKKIKGNENILRKIKKQGHDIGNHTYSHKQLIFRSSKLINEEIKKTYTLLIKNKIKTSFLRFPYYPMNIFGFNSAKRNNMKIIFADVDSRDYWYNNRNNVILRVLKKVKNGSIVAFHDYIGGKGRNFNLPFILEEIIPSLKQKGFRFVTISSLLNNL